MHQCIKCGAKLKSSEEILKGCPKCGSTYFKYSSEGKEKKIEVDVEKGESIETIMVKQHGIYEVNLTPLLEDDSIIVSDEEGKYVIDLNFLLKKRMKEKQKSNEV
ncbi:Zn-ribbon domain-containing protein [Methanobacterium alcaliphilum]|uniref:Zn-ribbon domain-containing protein n=1 Tax=Methanobacterium alcaliphilum TaxID=392018 RepID=UPI00200AF813|nr:hypothetical protein [Methanobacterium alcaliphilum]